MREPMSPQSGNPLVAQHLSLDDHQHPGYRRGNLDDDLDGDLGLTSPRRQTSEHVVLAYRPVPADGVNHRLLVVAQHHRAALHALAQ